jgi:DNA repair protein RadA/Sms
LRATKNRFGSTNEIGVFEMGEKGLQDVEDLSRCFIEEHSEPVSGSVLTATQEGSRTVIVEVQALVSSSSYPSPQRVCTGIDRQRLSILIAVLEKRVGLLTSNQDVFVNVVGGVRLVEPAADLSVALAIASAMGDVALPEGTVAVGEIGLAGEVRRVNQLAKRAKEASRLGLKRILIPSGNSLDIEQCDLEVIAVKNVAHAVAHLRG